MVHLTTKTTHTQKKRAEQLRRSEASRFCRSLPNDAKASAILSVAVVCIVIVASCRGPRTHARTRTAALHTANKQKTSGRRSEGASRAGGEEDAAATGKKKRTRGNQSVVQRARPAGRPDERTNNERSRVGVARARNENENEIARKRRRRQSSKSRATKS